ncbi:SDR family NAD(P)-dependent oxidoreductase [Solimonas sp. K1W22B-7]|uniref:SDR family oxidoreductase n=1 Tax=Solimonas sp. K1W22B-7 TaxID=2303331 RepID=UPI000E334523|nr:SDR family oxidoreductase [Solimonas sp. K1W22B-7]AXQ28668.1 SDR family NAD(P)-dependent oxidoreductase [Solimonas sp. K1W22B-7]
MSKTVLITGGNSGIGFEMALALAARGDRVIIAARDEAKSAAAVASIKAAHPDAQIAAVKLDLADFGHIDRFTEYLLKRVPVIDVLILNAGLYTLKLHTLPSGYEAMIGVMHFGHFRLVQRLLDAVVAAPQGRIVVTSSVMHKLGRIDARSFTNPKKHFSGLQAYGQAKLANLLFTRELARRLKDTRVTVNAFHPGAVATDIYRQVPAALRRLATAFMLTPKQGADTAVWMATDEKFKGVTGKYYVSRQRRRGSAASRDPELAAKLWQLSERAMKAS